VKAISGLMVIGTGIAEDMNGGKEGGIDHSQAVSGMMATGTRQGVVGGGTAVIGNREWRRCFANPYPRLILK
jgi:hypothetical protein